MLTTVLAGDLDQSRSGKLVFDSDHLRGRSDRLEIGGNALLGGTIKMRPRTLTKTPVTVLGANSLTIDPGLTAARTLVFNFEPRVAGNSVVVTPHADFTPGAPGRQAGPGAGVPKGGP